MADDVTLPGNGSAVATDELGGRHFQWVKLCNGDDGSAVPVFRGQGLAVQEDGITKSTDRSSASETASSFMNIGGDQRGWVQFFIRITSGGTAKFRVSCDTPFAGSQRPIWHSNRTTSSALHISPRIPVSHGENLRVHWDITAGTVTFEIRTIRGAGVVPPVLRFIDHDAGIAAGTLNATTASVLTNDVSRLMAVVESGHAGSSGEILASYQLEGSFTGVANAFFPISDVVAGGAGVKFVCLPMRAGLLCPPRVRVRCVAGGVNVEPNSIVTEILGAE